MSADADGPDAFTASRARFAELVDWLEKTEVSSHGELEAALDGRFQGLLRQLMADHLSGERQARPGGGGGAEAKGTRR